MELVLERLDNYPKDFNNPRNPLDILETMETIEIFTKIVKDLKLYFLETCLGWYKAFF